MFKIQIKTNHLVIKIALFLFLMHTGIVSAAPKVHNAGHIDINNRSPIVSLFHLSRANQVALENGETQYATSAEVSNYISNGSFDDEALVIDGESYFIEQRITHRRGQHLFGVSIPYIRHSGGFLDRLIFDFHDTLKLPQNGRTDFQHDEQLIQLTVNGQELVNISDREEGLGDITFSYGQILNESTQAFLTIKAPTGDFDSQTGSEGWDLGLSWSQLNPEWLQERNWLKDSSLSFWWGGSINYLSDADDLSELDAYPVVVTGRLGFAWSPIQDWSLKTQFDTNSPLFDSDIRELGWIPVQISFSSAHYFFNRQHKLEFSIAEDLRPRTTPDVVFGLLYQTKI